MSQGILKKLHEIQTTLKVPKNQLNKFGGYKYRSAEDILETLKPRLEEMQLVLTLTDEIKHTGDRYHIEATATLIDIEDGSTHSVKGWAREEESKKGMDGSQITGASSSYARKYALNGLFAIDDAKDSDHTNQQNQKAKDNGNGYNKKLVEELSIRLKEYQDKAELKEHMVELRDEFIKKGLETTSTQNMIKKRVGELK